MWGEGWHSHRYFCHSIEGRFRPVFSVLSSNQIARRWHDCNPQHSLNGASAEEEEEAWRSKCLEFISSAHTLGALSDLSFETTKSSFSVRHLKHLISSGAHATLEGLFILHRKRHVPMAMGDIQPRTAYVSRHTVQAPHFAADQHDPPRLLLR